MGKSDSRRHVIYVIRSDHRESPNHGHSQSHTRRSHTSRSKSHGHTRTKKQTRAAAEVGHSKYLKVSAYCQLILGILSILLGATSIFLRTYLFVIAAPIWCGLCFFVVAGVIGIATARYMSAGLVIAYTIMSVLACIAAFVVAGFGAGAISTDRLLCPEDWYGESYALYGYYRYCNISHASRVAIDSCILAVGVLEFIAALIGATSTCGCSCKTHQQEEEESVEPERQLQPTRSRRPQNDPYYDTEVPLRPFDPLDYPGHDYHLSDTLRNSQPPPYEPRQSTLPRRHYSQPLPPPPIEGDYQTIK